MNRGIAFAVLAAGVAIISSAPILTRFAQAEAASSSLIAAGRLTIAALLMAPLALSRARAEIFGIRLRELLLCACSGALLGVHFWTWIASLEHTSVANSTVLVTTNPVWVAILSVWVLKEPPSRGQIAGVVLTLFGAMLIFLAENTHGNSAGSPMLGNFLALLGAIAASGYLLIGRSLRTHLGLTAYVWLTYSFAAIVLVLAALAAGESVSGASPTAWLFIAALALGPQLLGHTSLNWALRRLSATFVALSILGEPIGAALLAWWLFHEGFVGLQLAGFLALLVGIVIAARAERGTQNSC